MPGLTFLGFMALPRAFYGQRVAGYVEVDVRRVDPRYLCCNDHVIIACMNVQVWIGYHRLPPRQGKNVRHFPMHAINLSPRIPSPNRSCNGYHIPSPPMLMVLNSGVFIGLLPEISRGMKNEKITLYSAAF
jgi:hypothetical protein